MDEVEICEELAEHDVRWVEAQLRKGKVVAHFYHKYELVELFREVDGVRQQGMSYFGCTRWLAVQFDWVYLAKVGSRFELWEEDDAK